MIHLAQRAHIGLCVLALLAAPRPSRADDAAERAAAVQLFDDGDKLIQEGRYAEACPKLAESNRLDPQLGALLYLAQCYEKNGQIASAWGSYREAEEIAQKRKDERAAEAGERARALTPRLSRLVLRPMGQSPAPGLEVTRDGIVVDRTQWGTAIAVDVGKHAIVATAPGYQRWSEDVEVKGEGTTLTVDVPALVPEPKPKQVGPELIAEGVPVPGGSQRMAAIAIGGLGLVGVGVGGFFGLSAQSTYSDSKAECNERNRCTSQGLELRASAKDKALVATIASGIGAAALVTGAVLWFTASTKSSEQHGAQRRRQALGLAPNEHGMGLDLRGEF